MKTLLYFFSLLVILSVHGQHSKFEKAILKGKAMMENSATISDYANAANYFERIAKNEPDQWLPVYYRAQANMIIGNKLKGQEQETYYQEALDQIGEIKNADKNAEVLALEGFIQMMRLSADPGTRGQSLSPVVFGLFRKAINFDNSNPRALLFMGQMEYGTAQFFGSSSDKACEYINNAVALFENKSNESTVYPSWGNSSAQLSVKNCNQ
ncbi:MAG: tetratricopeptide (TPR) repeat protein [Cyclobacteriaceae bacterium]|jgi:tetratricopeptide (TPR) repeat protein